MAQRNAKRAFWSWLAVALWLALIALESSDALSSTHTGSILYGIVTALFGPIDLQRFEVFHHLLRKSGHFMGYGMLSLLLFRALRQTFAATAHPPSGATLLVRFAGWFHAERRWAFLAVILTMLVAALDEFHQSLIPSRTGTVRDVILDTLGALCVQAVVLLALRRRSQYRIAAD